MTKPTKWLCVQRRLRSAQSDQSLRCPHEESLGPQLPIERTVKTQADLSLRWAHSHFVGFVMSRLMYVMLMYAILPIIMYYQEVYIFGLNNSCSVIIPGESQAKI